MSIEDEKDINTYFSRNYEQGKALDISCPDKKSNQSWNDWKNWRLRKKGGQKNGKPFLTKKNKWKSEEPPRRLLREAGKSSGRGIHPSHLEFKVFLQDRIERMNNALMPGINELKWNSQNIDPFINSAMNIVKDVDQLVKKMKDNVNKMQDFMV